MRICFELWTDDSASMLGLLCEITGSRPSDMVGWSDPDDSIQRLFFDIFIVGKIKREK